MQVLLEIYFKLKSSSFMKCFGLDNHRISSFYIFSDNLFVLFVKALKSKEMILELAATLTRL